MLKNFIILATTVLIDYFSKYWIVHKLAYHQYLELLNTKLFGINLFLTYNSGIAFGIFHTNQQANTLFLILSAGAIIIMTYLILAKKIVDHIEQLAILLILSGAIGNILDRVIYGHVIDFIDFYVVFNKIQFHWYTFNIADSVICAGTLLFTYKIIRG